jgi:hypothetical protein
MLDSKRYLLPEKMNDSKRFKELPLKMLFRKKSRNLLISEMLNSKDISLRQS